ncbi:MAG TPA: M15 family metallopeptidase [Steroidobacteraceae bacterium]|nr:M15 family metallopeptidase [Steroidobacteraceae bacterium]
MNSHELTGRTRSHILDLTEPPCRLHRDAVAAYVALRKAAASAGHVLVPVSSFRDFEHQARIWNAKFRGERPMFDAGGQPLDAAQLGDEDKVSAILLWSALPGASRHHWGSEIDVIDRAAIAADYQPRLLPAEFEPGGPFAAFDGWLDQNMARFEFFRPYRTDRGGVRPEPWHLSYAPVALPALQMLTPELLSQALASQAIEGLAIVRSRIVEIHERYVLGVDAP